MAFQLIFASDFTEMSAETIIDGGHYCEELGLPCSFSRELFVGTSEHLPEIDGLIEQTAIDWQLNRMPLADKAILRLAIFEMLYMDDIPLSVSIDEAVELAKDFGGADRSPAFVNGVLGHIAESMAPRFSINKAKSRKATTMLEGS
jgi:N utilization substance protein B